MPSVIHLLGLMVLTSCEPLGKQSGKQYQVKSVTGFLQSPDFYTNHVIPGIPVLFKGAAKSFPAYKLWTDQYLGSFEESKSYLVDIEEGKKENRSLGFQQPSFKKFLEMYQKEDVYFVSGVPEFLRKDIPIYDSINCPYILDKLLIDLVMWFSSGGTTSVWHNDGYENINCLIKGEKTLIMANKSDLANVYLDIPNGAYSSIDVDNVDDEKYPLLKHVQFYNVSMEAGDCLYIPTRWFHYVNSYNRNIAINKWWHSHKSPIPCEEKSRHTTTQTLDVLGAGADEEDGPLYRVLLTKLYMTEHLYTHHSLPRDIFSDITQDVLEDRGYFTGEDSIFDTVQNFFTNLLGLNERDIADEVEVLFEELDSDTDNELSYAELDLITEQLLTKVLPKTEL